MAMFRSSGCLIAILALLLAKAEAQTAGKPSETELAAITKRGVLLAETHVVSELPEDTDVFLVLNRKPQVPEIVIAGAYMFTIDVNGRITVEDKPR